MPQPISNTPAPRRRHHRRRRIVSAPAPLEVVEVLGVTPIASMIIVELLLNTTEADPLNDASGADAGKWSAIYAGNRFVGTSLETSSYNRLLVTLTNSAPETGANVISYSANPSDIGDAAGRMLGAIVDLPL